MRGNDFLDKMELIDSAYIEAADIKPKKRKRTWLNYAAAAACLCLIISAVVTIPFLKEPEQGDFDLSNKTTAKISYGSEEGVMTSSEVDLVYLTESEMFSHEKMYVFRGRVSGLSNITIDFNGVKEARCIATVLIEKVYKGDIAEGEQITMLLPCAIYADGSAVEDTGVISQIECGMEGIYI